jgi:hypothetical protein
MLLNTILACLVVVTALNVLMVFDLYGRSAKLAKLVQEARLAVKNINHLLRKVTERSDAAS